MLSTVGWWVMTSSAEHGQMPRVVRESPSEVKRLRAENEQLRQAVSSHAVVDQAIGALVVLGRIGPEDGFELLREVSQRTNTKLHTVASQVLYFAQGGSPGEPFMRELGGSLARRTGTTR